MKIEICQTKKSRKYFVVVGINIKLEQDIIDFYFYYLAAFSEKLQYSNQYIVKLWTKL